MSNGVIAMRNLVTLVLALVLWGATTAASASNFIQNVGSGKCMQPAGGSLAEGAPIIQTTCNDSAIQRWEFLPANSTGTLFRLRNVVSGRCLDVAGWANNHTPIQ